MAIGYSAKELLNRNNYHLFYIFLSKGAYADAFVICKAYALATGSTEALVKLEAMERGNDNIFFISEALSKGTVQIIPGKWGLQMIHPGTLREKLRGMKVDMAVIMNELFMEASSSGAIPTLPEGLPEIPENMFTGMEEMVSG